MTKTAQKEPHQDPFALSYYAMPLLEKKGSLSVLEIGPSMGQDIWELFADLSTAEKQKIVYDGVELWLEEEPKGITILKENNPSQIQYFPGQDIFTFNPQHNYDLVYAKAVPLDWGQRGVDLLKHLTPFLNPGAQFVILYSQDWYTGPLEEPCQEDLANSIYSLQVPLSNLGFSIEEVDFSFPLETLQQNTENQNLFCAQETIEKACIALCIKSFLKGCLQEKDLIESVDIPISLLEDLKDIHFQYRKKSSKWAEKMHFEGQFTPPPQVRLSPFVMQQLNGCSLKEEWVLEIKECEILQKKPWKDLSLIERQEVMDEVWGLDDPSLRVIVQKNKN
ncbi:MAG: hypothetical protein BGO07_02940 [Alphaproteobacteria bacterium 40-19]|nr:MAG: hypothetical protein BGO07_02940 [Alphaproteobacteria bacterium 40-19]